MFSSSTVCLIISNYRYLSISLERVLYIYTRSWSTSAEPTCYGMTIDGQTYTERTLLQIQVFTGSTGV